MSIGEVHWPLLDSGRSQRMSRTRSKFPFALVLIAGVLACAEPQGVTVPTKKQTAASGASGKSSTKSPSTSSDGGSTGAEETSPSEGGAPKSTAPVGNGGNSDGSSTEKPSKGGTDNTATPTSGSGGKSDPATTAPSPTSCESSSDEVKVTATSAQKGASGSTTIVPASGASIAVADLKVKFCFTISSNLTEKAFIISYASVTTTVAPYNIVLSTAAVTLEKGTDGSSCLLIDVGGVKDAASVTLEGTAKLGIDWRLDNNAIGTSTPDASKPAQFMVIKGSSVIGCGDVPLSST